VKRKGLRYNDVNVLVRAVRAGLSWDEAKAQLPGIDEAALDAYREHVEAEAAKTPPVEQKVRLTADESEELAQEVKDLQAQLAEAVKERDEAGEQAAKLNADLNELREENAKLKAEIESLLIDDKPTKKK
jgi:peptidoglycan hydrolase CwlO-like protein